MCIRDSDGSVGGRWDGQRMDLSELFLWALAGTVLGAAFAVLAVRSRYAARLALSLIHI